MISVVQIGEWCWRGRKQDPVSLGCGLTGSGTKAAALGCGGGMGRRPSAGPTDEGGVGLSVEKGTSSLLLSFLFSQLRPCFTNRDDSSREL